MQIQNVDTTTATAATVAVLIERKPLVAALSYLSGSIVERANTIPIVSCIVIEACEAGARILGTDLDIYASCELPGAWETPGSIVADARALLAAVKACEGDTIKLQADAGAVIVSGEGVASRVPSLPRGDFPAAKPIGETAFFVVNAPELAGDWRRVSSSISTEETRYYLNGVFMHAPTVAKDEAPVLTFASTDGHRLTRVRRPLPSILGAKLSDIIIPRKAVAATLKALGNKPGASDIVGFHVTAERVRIVAGAWTLDSKVIDGTFPDYSRVIPTHNSKRATFNAASLAKVSGAIVKAQGRDAKAVKLSINAATGATLSATGADGGNAAGGLGASWRDTAGEGGNAPAAAFAMGFNPRYLQAIAELFGDGEAVGHIADAGAPVLWTCPTMPELIAVLMPMRVDGATPAPKRATEAAEKVATPHDVFELAYAVAWAARDVAGMAAAVEALRSSGAIGSTVHAFNPARVHYQVAMIAARVRRDNSERGTDGWRTNDAAMRRASRIDAQLCRSWGKSSFRDLGRRAREEAERAATHAATLAAIVGYRADDPRRVVPVILTDGRKGFVTQESLSNLALYYVDLTKADGTPTRSRRMANSVRRDMIARVSQPVARRERVEAVAPAAPAADVVALQAQVAALAATVAELVAAAAVVNSPTVSDAVAPLPVPVDGTDARDSYIAALLAEREELRDRAEAAEAKATDLQRIAEAAEAKAGEAFEQRLRAAKAESVLANAEQQRDTARAERDRARAVRGRTARRLATARATARTARRECIGQETARRIAETELQRLAPLAAALAGLIQPAAPVTTGGNVVPLHAAA